MTDSPGTRVTSQKNMYSLKSCLCTSKAFPVKKKHKLDIEKTISLKHHSICFN